MVVDEERGEGGCRRKEDEKRVEEDDERSA